MNKSAEFERRNLILRFRVNAEELSYIESKAAQRKFSISEYLRFCALRRRESRVGSLSRQLSMLNCVLLEHAAEAGAQLDFEAVAKEIAQLCALVEKGIES